MTEGVSSFAAFYRTSWQIARDAAWEILGSRDDAEDVAQRVLMRTLRNGTWRTVEDPDSHAYVAARHEARSVLRTRKRRQRRHRATPLSYDMCRPPPPADSRLREEETFRHLEQMIVRLPPRCQLMCSLVFLQGCTHPEVAKRLGVSVGAVEKQIARGPAKMRQMRDEGVHF